MTTRFEGFLLLVHDKSIGAEEREGGALFLQTEGTKNEQKQFLSLSRSLHCLEVWLEEKMLL